MYEDYEIEEDWEAYIYAMEREYEYQRELELMEAMEIEYEYQRELELMEAMEKERNKSIIILGGE